MSGFPDEELPVAVDETRREEANILRAGLLRIKADYEGYEAITPSDLYRVAVATLRAAGWVAEEVDDGDRRDTDPAG